MLPFVLLGSMDDAGQPWASLLAGSDGAGFASSPEPSTLALRALPFAGDPLARTLALGRPLGVLGIQLETRRRNRVNGHVSALHADGFELQVAQAFGNCPKYITVRQVQHDATRARAGRAQRVRAESAQLSAAARRTIERADTSFIASASGAAPDASDSREGVDVSHRGGAPGFMHLEPDAPERASALWLPDYVGNNMFNTLGNLQRYPRAGLLVQDFSSGDLLMLACDAELVWDGPALAALPGARRATRLRVREGLCLEGVLPFRTDR